MGGVRWFIVPKAALYRADAMTNWQMGFQDAATPIMEGIIDLHHDLFAFMIGILTFVTWMLVRINLIFNSVERSSGIVYNRQLTHDTMIEIIWTITPVLILLSITVPSYALLYAMEDIVKPRVTVKVIGHQWYWSYEYNDKFPRRQIYMAPETWVNPEKQYGYDYMNHDIYDYFYFRDLTHIEFDSYMVDEDDLKLGQLRLLETTKHVAVPMRAHIRFLVTSSDVLHSWAIPALGVKIDACPGRLNQIFVYIKRGGVFYGQCSEICGINHAFMPIVVEAMDGESFYAWCVFRNSRRDYVGMPDLQYSLMAEPDEWSKTLDFVTLAANYATYHKYGPEIRTRTIGDILRTGDITFLYLLYGDETKYLKELRYHVHNMRLAFFNKYTPYSQTQVETKKK